MSSSRKGMSPLDHVHQAAAEGLTIHSYAKKYGLNNSFIYVAAKRERKQQQLSNGEMVIKKIDTMRLHLGDGYIDLSFEDLQKLLK